MNQAVNLWNQPGVPHKGWIYLSATDQGEASHVCEMCGKTGLRYTHHMKHPDSGQELAVGRVCAGKMEDDGVTP